MCDFLRKVYDILCKVYDILCKNEIHPDRVCITIRIIGLMYIKETNGGLKDTSLT